MSSSSEAGRTRCTARLSRLLLCLLLLQPAIFASFSFGSGDAWARNGGYSRPSSSGYSMPTPRSFSSGSGGYSRPSSSSSNSYRPSFSGGDGAISQRSSGQALQAYKSSNERRPAVDYGSGGGGIFGNTQRRPEAPSGFGSSWGQRGSYPTPPPAYAAGPSRFGAWDAVMLWALLSAVNTPRSQDFFSQNQNDPGYLKWRAEMNQLAAKDPDVAAKLAQLDTQLAQAKPKQTAAQAPADGGFTMLILVIGLAIFLGLWVMRWRARRPKSMVNTAMNAAPGITGSTQTRFRVGMTIPLDPTPFILSGGMTKVVPPPEGNLISVDAIGLISDGAGAAGSVSLHRLYLPGGGSFFSLHLDRLGQPDECRYFSLIDQVTPATQEDWAFWLDPAEGMIGWPEFQTKDDVLYGRVWASGQARIAPRDQTETLRGLSGDTSRAMHAMLYGRATSAAPPAPATEYILVEAVEQDGSAWVDIHAGIDINPAALTLPPVAFD